MLDLIHSLVNFSESGMQMEKTKVILYAFHGREAVALAHGLTKQRIADEWA
ncbi:MAG: hypothetical protein NTY46_03060 [Candidatus Sumerlaeota bacterium]|nr:hypothetical protein [Candidatus Sumerlaeota bacterium]